MWVLQRRPPPPPGCECCTRDLQSSPQANCFIVDMHAADHLKPHILHQPLHLSHRASAAALPCTPLHFTVRL